MVPLASNRADAGDSSNASTEKYENDASSFPGFDAVTVLLGTAAHLTTLEEAEARMRARNTTLAAVVATVATEEANGGEEQPAAGAALGVLEAGAAAAERDAAALSAALRAHEATAARGGETGSPRARGANVPR